MKKLVNYIKSLQKTKVYLLNELTYKDLVEYSKQENEDEFKETYQEDFFVFETDLLTFLSAWELFGVEYLFVDESNFNKGVILVVVADMEKAKDNIDALIINLSNNPDETAKKLREKEYS